MLFEVVHATDYRYSVPVSEACLEARLTPPPRADQEVVSHKMEFSPPADTSAYLDYFGNMTTFYSMTLRHERLTVTNRLTVRTGPKPRPSAALNVTVAEARQIFSSALTDVFDYLQPTEAVPTGGGHAAEWTRKYLRGDARLGEAVQALNSAIAGYFKYRPGATESDTALPDVWKMRAGVCQDFSHIMLSVLRTAGLPARYVCGYIGDQAGAPGGALQGSLATHAWVEVMVPGLRWVALDPTNNQWGDERHITVAYGRDFEDAAPVRGTFKGAGSQSMDARVTTKHLLEKP